MLLSYDDILKYDKVFIAKVFDFTNTPDLSKYDNIQIFKHNSGIYETAWDYEEVVEDCKGLIREYLSLLGVEVWINSK